ncbi:hypothetical protein AKO1_004261 [Acrasis kona]|uniref:Uncharacterized protein n=1 Tax=Acrasis kona TaxID=1008807 RepID=A0AAW2Z7L3_9EUKA
MDVPKTEFQKKIFIPVIALGMNSIAVYAFDNIFFDIFGRPGGYAYIHYGRGENNLLNWTYQTFYTWMNDKTAAFMWALTDSAFNVVFALILYKKKIFFKI